MRVLALQHVPFEDLAGIDLWLREHSQPVSRIRLFAGETLPDPTDDDLIIALGGPLSVNDEADHPWLRAEKEFLRLGIERGARVLGVCLGAQLVASALHQRVAAAPQPEIGWFPVERVDAPVSCFAFLPRQLFFHWHFETFDLPAGAVHLARSEACTNQAFQLGSRVIAVQFHPEAITQSVAALVSHCRADLVPRPFVQSEAAIARQATEAYAASAITTGRILEYLTSA